MFKIRSSYLKVAALLLGIEIIIALFVHDSFVRPYVGDFLVVILIYCFIRSFFSFRILTAAIGVLLFSCLVEFSQYFHLVKRTGLEKSTIAKIILGTSFSWTDILMYILGIAAVLLTEFKKLKRE